MLVARRRRDVAGWLTLLVAAALLYPALPAAADAYDDSCATPTQVDIGGNQTYNLASGQVLLILGTYTGVINTFPSGAVICVATTSTFQPGAINNPAGVILVRGTAVLPATGLNTGFVLDNFGTTTFPSGVNVNGAAAITNSPHAVMSFGTQLNWGGNGTLVNEGDMTITGGLNQNNGSIQNSGDLGITGAVNLNGAVSNSGTIAITATQVNINGTADLDNDCTVTVSGGVTNNAAGSANNGIYVVGGHFQNNGGGGVATGPGSVLASNTLGNDGSITGSGAVRIEGNSLHQGTVAGDPVNMINIYDVTQTNPPQLFDTQTGSVSNAVRAVIPAPDPDTVSPGCAGQPVLPPSADLLVEKGGVPSNVFIRETVTYTITVTNLGPDPATSVVLTDEFETGFVPIAGPGRHLVSRFALFAIGDIESGDSVSVEVTGTYALSGTFVDSALVSAAEEDPDTSNNSGTNPEAMVTTTVINRPVTLNGTLVTTVTDSSVAGQVVGSDPDFGQTLGYTAADPTSGSVTIDGTGTFNYLPDPGFAGRDQFEVTACDNGTPQLCDSAQVLVEVFPMANDDEDVTTEGLPVTVEVEANDLGLVGLPMVVTMPASGTAVPGNSITYTPDPGFIGTDRFTYEICAVGEPDLCDQAVVSIGVAAVTTSTSSTVSPSTVAPSSTVAGGGGSSTTLAGDLPLTGVEIIGLFVVGLLAAFLGMIVLHAGRDEG